MALADLSDWLDGHTVPDVIWYVKRLSANDTGANRTHQAGPHMAREFLFQIFPGLNRPREKNPRVEFDLYIDSHADYRKITAIWYNGKVLGDGTRNEARLTNFGGQSSALLDPDSTGALAVFAFRLDGSGAAIDCHAWVCDHEIQAEVVEDRIGAVEPGKALVWRLNQVQPIALSNKNCWLQAAQMPPEWLSTFPPAAQIVRKSVALRPLPNHSPDMRLLKRRDCEFELFRSIEQALELPRIRAGFGTIDDFIVHAQTILQRRKSRAGRSLELHVREIFMEESLVEGTHFSSQSISEGRKRPDFLFPSQSAYQNADFPASKLRMLAVKTTCRDRWRQILNEADRIRGKHLLTLQEGISESQFREMTAEGVQLVIPHQRMGAFPATIRPHLQTLESFIGDVRLLALS